jgi:hypothetical protein
LLARLHQAEGGGANPRRRKEPLGLRAREEIREASRLVARDMDRRALPLLAEEKVGIGRFEAAA